MKTRQIFTVIREDIEPNVEAAKESFAVLHDEAGEFLYGGCRGRGGETIQVELQVKIGNRWSTIARTEPQ